MELYKYASGDSGLKIFEGLRLKITPPNELNDPFEFTPHSVFTQTKEKVMEKARKYPEKLRPVYNDMSGDGKFSGSFEEFIADYFPKAISQEFIQYKKLSIKAFGEIDMRTPDTVSQGIGILCLSRLHDSIPMWSYYANHHRGIVFGFDASKIGAGLVIDAGFVKYREKRARVDPHISRGCNAWKKQRQDLVLTKSKVWKHEQEYRRAYRLSDLISQMPEQGQLRSYFLDISSDAIRSIIFGCHVDSNLEEKIRREVQRRRRTFGHVQLLRCEKNKTKYALKIVPAGLGKAE